MKTLAARWIRGCLVCSSWTPLPVLAQAASTSDSGPQVEDIVGTAHRRSEHLQSVPIAVSAITSDQAAAQGLTGTPAMTAIAPTLQITQTYNIGSISLRGVV